MKEPAQKIPPQIVGNAGLFYVCHKLSALGWNAMPTSRNARGVDVMCFSLDGKRRLLLQVKSLSKRNAVPLGSSIDKVMGDFWVIVTGATCEKPICCILTPQEVRALGHSSTKDGKRQFWLEPKQYAVAEFSEQWTRIGSGC